MSETLVIDIGGTKIAAAVVDDAGSVLRFARQPTPAHADATTVFDVVARVVADVRTGQEEACGIACAGQVEEGGLVTTTNIAGWTRFPLRASVERLTDLPTRLENDGRALALAERVFGVASGIGTYMAVTVSTGIGSGIVSDGFLLHGGGNAGEVGHIVVEPGGDLCGCGGRGCLETVASGLAIERRTGRPAAEASDAVRAGAARTIAVALAPVVTALDVELVVLSGGVARGFGRPFVEAVEAALRENVTPLIARRPILVKASGLGDDAGVLAAAAVTRGGPSR